MSEHTPGKLARRPDAGQWNVSTDECGMSCYESIQDDEGTIIGFVVAHKAGFYQEPNTEANARRLVAAWNACEGIPTERLESSEGLFVAIGDAFTRCNSERDSLRAVNAELIEALENIMQHIGSENHHPDGEWVTEPIHIDEVNAARAAIASARKQENRDDA